MRLTATSLLFPLLMVLLLPTGGCRTASVEGPAQPSPTAPTAATALPSAPPDPAALPPAGAADGSAAPAGAASRRAITIVADEACRAGSVSEVVSLSMKEASLTDVLQLIGAMTELDVRVEGADVSQVLVTAELNSYPWDCVVQSVASQLGLALQLEGKTLTLRAPA